MARELSSPSTQPQPSHDEIARRAYEIFERNGSQPGRDMENWIEAERELKAAPRPSPSAKQPRASEPPAKSGPRSSMRTATR